MAKFFLKTVARTGGSTPSNSNDGRDAIGFNLATATYDDTGNPEGEHHLSSTGAFTSYSFTAGDEIYLSGGTGITPGLYAIASRVDNDAILLTASAGSDSTSDVTSSDGPWSTIQYAADTINTAGDIANICADGTHTISTTIDYDTNAVSVINPIVFLGVNATGAFDGSVPTVSGSGLGASSNLIYLNLDGLSVCFAFIRFTAATQYNIEFGTAFAGPANVCFQNCRIDNASSNGVYYGESISEMHVKFINCEIDTNGAHGYGVSGLERGTCEFVNCEIHDNTSNGIYESGRSGKSKIIGCVIYDNGAHGVEYRSNSGGHIIMNTVLFGNTSDGLNIHATAYCITVINVISRSNGGYGFNTNTGNIGQFSYFDYNCSSNNTSGHIDVNGGTLPGNNNTTSNPNFTSETDGSEDFSLQSGSPCEDVGLGYGDNWNMGAWQNERGGAGGTGGLMTAIGMNGGIDG
jgi:hypothetical protein